MSRMHDTTTEKTQRRSRLPLVLALVGAVLIVLVLVHLFARKPTREGAPPQSVEVAKAASGDMPVTLTELGTVTPNATVTVLPELSGYLTAVGYHEGQDVEKGQFLAEIDPRQYEIELQEEQSTLLKDQATLDEARSDLARYEQLRKQQAIAEQQVTDQRFLVKQDEAQVEIDQANIAQYQLDLVYCHITAPVAGRVGLRLVDPGNYVTATSSTGIVVITTMKPTTVEFTVAQDDLGDVIQRFNSGAKLPVTVYTSDNTREIATGTLYAINNQMNVSTGTVTLRATFPNQDEALFPDEFVNVKMLVDTLKGVVFVPTPAVLSGAPGNYVYLVNSNGKASGHPHGQPMRRSGHGHPGNYPGNANDTVSVRKVTLGPSNGQDTAILSGLSVGDVVVIDGTDRLSDGAAISIATPQNAAGRAPAKKP